MGTIATDSPEFEQAEKNVKLQIEALMSNGGSKPADYFHKKLGKIMWDKVGMARNAEGLTEAQNEIAAIRDEFYKEVKIPGTANSFNPELAKALRIADFLELGELFAKDALHRNESCGGHFREEYQTPEGEAQRDDENFAYVAAWEYKGKPSDAVLHKEELKFENVKLVQRSYK
jgi:succinate dehydrogenase / fumarate reductase flavoprotein subunit